MSKTAIGIDIGGSNIKGVLLNETGQILDSRTMPTSDDIKGSWQMNVLDMVKVIRERNNVLIDTIGITSPGLANETNTAIAYLPNRLSGIENLIWDELLDSQTFVMNDAHAALLAESTYGCLCLKDHSILFYSTPEPT
jgi:glucokinase